MSVTTTDDVLNADEREEFVKDAITQSSALTFIDCGVRHEFRFMKGIKNPPNSAITVGSTFHKTTEHNYRQKRETHEDLPVAELKDFFATEFEEKSKEVQWTREEKAMNISTVRNKLIKTGQGCVGAYQTEIAPTIQPVASEKPFRIKFDNDIPYDLATRGIDLIGTVLEDDDEQAAIFRPEGDVIFDLKTASARKRGADHSLQLSLYAIGYRMMTGKVERGLQLDTAVKTKTPSILREPTMRTDNQLKSALKLIGRVIQNIEHAKRTGAFLPTNPKNWWCSSEWCGYWNICEFGGKK